VLARAEEQRLAPVGSEARFQCVNISSYTTGYWDEGDTNNPEVVPRGQDEYLVVWQDCGIYYPASVWGARVNTSGTVLDTTGIVIRSGWLGYGEPRCPSVAFGATTYLVLWEDSRNDYDNKDIYGTRVGQSGAILDSLNISMSTDINEQRNPAVSFDSTNYLVVWEDTRNDHSDIYGTRVGQSGNILDPTGIPVTTDPSKQRFPAIAFNGSRYLAAWSDNRGGDAGGIHGTRIAPNGNILDTAEIEIDEGWMCDCPSVASSGLHYLIAWHKVPPWSKIEGARVHQGGWSMDPGGFLIADPYSLYPSVAFDGTNYLVVFRGSYGVSYRDIYGTRVTQAGTVLDPAGFVISTAEEEQGYPSVAFDGTNYLVVWQDGRSGSDSDIYGARVAPSGNVLDPDGIPISTASNDQSYPAVAFDGTNYLVVWQDDRNGSWDIYGAKLNTSGVMIDTFSVSLRPGDQIAPTLAHGAEDQFLITYSGWTGEYGGKIYNTTRIWGKFYPSVGVEEDAQCLTPYAQRLLQISPNPFRHKTDIRFQWVDASDYELKIYDATGRLVKDFSPVANAVLRTQISWDGTDQANRKLSSGIYFLKLQARDYSATEKLLLIR